MDPNDDLVNITFNKANESLTEENVVNTIKHEPIEEQPIINIKQERRQSYSSVETDTDNDFESSKKNLTDIKNEPGSGDDTENDDEDNEDKEENKKQPSSEQPMEGERIVLKEEENNSDNGNKTKNRIENDSDGFERIQRSSIPETNYNPFNARPTYNPFAEMRNVKVEPKDRYAPMDYDFPAVVKTEPQNELTQSPDAQMELENTEGPQADDDTYNQIEPPMPQTSNAFEMDQTSNLRFELEQPSTSYHIDQPSNAHKMDQTLAPDRMAQPSISYQTSQPSTSHRLEQPTTSYHTNQASNAYQMDSTSYQTNKASEMYDYMSEKKDENNHKQSTTSMPKCSLLELVPTNFEIEDDGFDLRPEVLDLVKEYRERKISETQREFDRIQDDLENPEKKSERGELMKRLNKVIDDMQKQKVELTLEQQRESEEQHEERCTQFLRETFDEFFDHTKWDTKFSIHKEQKYDSKPSTSSSSMPNKSDRKRLNFSEFMHIRKKPKDALEKAKTYKFYDECAKKMYKTGQSVPEEMIKPVLKTKGVICEHVKRFLRPLAQKHSLNDNVFTLITKNATAKHFQNGDYGKYFVHI